MNAQSSVAGRWITMDYYVKLADVALSLAPELVKNEHEKGE
jgi:hypothetical protein